MLAGAPAGINSSRASAAPDQMTPDPFQHSNTLLLQQMPNSQLQQNLLSNNRNVNALGAPAGLGARNPNPVTNAVPTTLGQNFTHNFTNALNTAPITTPVANTTSETGFAQYYNLNDLTNNFYKNQNQRVSHDLSSNQVTPSFSQVNSATPQVNPVTTTFTGHNSHEWTNPTSLSGNFQKTNPQQSVVTGVHTNVAAQSFVPKPVLPVTTATAVAASIQQPVQPKYTHDQMMIAAQMAHEHMRQQQQQQQHMVSNSQINRQPGQARHNLSHFTQPNLLNGQGGAQYYQPGFDSNLAAAIGGMSLGRPGQ